MWQKGLRAWLLIEGLEEEDEVVQRSQSTKLACWESRRNYLLNEQARLQHWLLDMCRLIDSRFDDENSHSEDDVKDVRDV